MADILDAAQQTPEPNSPASSPPSQDTPVSPAPSDNPVPNIPEPVATTAMPAGLTSVPPTQEKPAETSQVVDTLLEPKMETPPVVSPSEPTPTEPIVAAPVPPPKKGINLNRGIILSILLLMFVTLPLVAYYVSQQRQIAEIRSRASTTLPPGGSTYPSGIDSPQKEKCYSDCITKGDGYNTPTECTAACGGYTTPGTTPGSCVGVSCAPWETCTTLCGSSPVCLNILLPICPSSPTPTTTSNVTNYNLLQQCIYGCTSFVVTDRAACERGCRSSYPTNITPTPTPDQNYNLLQQCIYGCTSFVVTDRAACENGCRSSYPTTTTPTPTPNPNISLRQQCYYGCTSFVVTDRAACERGCDTSYPTPSVPYCNREKSDDCIYGCIANNNGGTCATAPPSSSTSYCNRYNNNACINGCIPDTKGGHCEVIQQPYCTDFNNQDCRFGCIPDSEGGTCKPTPESYCTDFNNQDCRFGCTPDTSGGTCKPTPESYCTDFNNQDCRFGCKPTTTGGECLPPPVTSSKIKISQSGCSYTNDTGATVRVCTFSGGCEGNFDSYCGPSWDQINDGSNGASCEDVPAGDTASCRGPAQVSCGSWQVDMSIDGVPSAGISGTDVSGCTTTPTLPPPPPPGCEGSECNSPTPTNPPGGQCNNIQVYKNGTLLTTADLAKLKAGDKVDISVIGTTATQGRVRVNGGDWAVSTTKDSHGGFTVPFTVPTGTTNFTIEGQLYINGGWQ